MPSTEAGASLATANEALKTRLTGGGKTSVTVANGMPRQAGPTTTGAPGHAERRFSRLRRAVFAGAAASAGLVTVTGQLATPAPSALARQSHVGGIALL